MDKENAKPVAEPYIGRRTGKVININARIDSDGFERISDYFPSGSDASDSDQELDSEEQPIPSKMLVENTAPKPYIGRRTGKVIDIKARLDSDGFERISDYFPDTSVFEDEHAANNKKPLKNATPVVNSLEHRPSEITLQLSKSQRKIPSVKPSQRKRPAIGLDTTEEHAEDTAGNTGSGTSTKKVALERPAIGLDTTEEHEEGTAGNTGSGTSTKKVAFGDSVRWKSLLKKRAVKRKFSFNTIDTETDDEPESQRGNIPQAKEATGKKPQGNKKPSLKETKEDTLSKNVVGKNRKSKIPLKVSKNEKKGSDEKNTTSLMSKSAEKRTSQSGSSEDGIPNGSPSGNNLPGDKPSQENKSGRRRTRKIPPPKVSARKKAPKKQYITRHTNSCTEEIHEATEISPSVHDITTSPLSTREVAIVHGPSNTRRKPDTQESPFENNENGLRRSRRHRVPPLQYWKNERIEYDRKKSVSGWVVERVIRNPTPERKQKVKKNRPRARPKKEARVVTESSDDEDMDVDPKLLPEGLHDSNNPFVRVINVDTMEEVEMRILHTPGMANFQPVGGYNQDDNDGNSPPMLVDKGFSYPIFGAGQLVLKPGAEKGRQHVRSDNMIFYITKGSALVSVHNQITLMEKGSSFFVPEGNAYNIKNPSSKNDVALFFTQIKDYQRS